MKTILYILLCCTTTAFAQTNIFPSSGNVGIGTNNPQSTLDVAGSGRFLGQTWFGYGSSNSILGYSWTNAALTTNSIEIVNNNGLVNNLSPTLAFHRYGSGGPQFRLDAHGSNVLYLESSGVNSSRNPNPYGGNANTYFSRLHIDGQLSVEKNVGIGIAAPTQKLEVSGMIKANADGSSWISGNFGSTVGDRVVIGNLDGKATIGAHNAVLNTWSNLIINRDEGYVGIGTASPQEKLSVNGKIRAKEIKVETANWPDYVFEEGYQIGTLEALENYIKKNKRLPEIPSAQEAETNGIALGEMNKLLLKKVEELTLQLIIVNKKVEELIKNKK